MKLLDHPVIRAVLVFTAMAAGLVALGLLLRPLLIPILVSFVVYALLSPMVDRLVRTGMARTWAITAVLLGMIGLMSGLLLVGIPMLSTQMAEFQQRLPNMWREVSELFTAAEAWIGSRFGVALDTTAVAEGGIEKLRNGGVMLVTGLTSVLANLASLVVLVPILTFFLLRDLRAIRNGLMDLLPNRSFELGWHIYAQVVEKLDRYFRGVMLQSAVMAAVTTTGFMLLGLDLAVVLGLLAGLLNIIPYVGPLLSMVAPALVVLASNSPDMWLLMGQAVGVVLIGQVIDNVLVVPTLIAEAADLHPLTVLGGIVVMGYFFGFMGMILAVPLLFSAKIVFLGLLLGMGGERHPAAA